MVGDPVFGNNFLNRKKELLRLNTYWEAFKKGSRTNIAVIGLRKTGKTSLFLEFQRNIKEEDSLCVMIILPSSDNISHFIDESIKSTFKSIIEKDFKDIKLIGLDLNTMSSVIAMKYPGIAYQALSLREKAKKDPRESFESLFDFFSFVQEETKSKMMIVMDEFQYVADYEVIFGEIIDLFRKKIMLNQNIWYLISGSSIRMLLRIVGNINEPTFEHFHRIELGGFDYTHAKQLVKKILGNSIDIPESTIGFIYEMTDGLPFYTGILCESLRNHCIENDLKFINNSAVTEVFLNELYKGSGRLYNYFENLIHISLETRGQGRLIEILKAISFGNHRPRDICNFVDMPLTSFSKFSMRLIDLSLIEKLDNMNLRGGYYDLKDTLLGYWLKNVYSVKEESSIQTIKDNLGAYKKSISKIIEIQNAEISKGFEARIKVLFHKFDGDIFNLEELPKFKSIDNYETEKGEIDLIAEETNGDFWITEIFNDHVDMKEYLKFIDKIGAYVKEKKSNLSKIIIVSLKSIDEEVIKKSKEEGIEIWYKEDINKLMKKHSLPRINY